MLQIHSIHGIYRTTDLVNNERAEQKHREEAQDRWFLSAVNFKNRFQFGSFI